MMPKFNANIKFKLNLRCFKYMSIKILDNNEIGKNKTPSHNTPK
jgi:hypothetical protein